MEWTEILNYVFCGTSLVGAVTNAQGRRHEGLGGLHDVGLGNKYKVYWYFKDWIFG